MLDGFPCIFSSYKDWREKRGLVAPIIWAGELQNQLCKQSPLLSYNMLLLFQSSWGLKKKRKKETKPKNAQTLPISFMPYLSVSLLFWHHEEGYQNVIQPRVVILSYRN